jgi:hypothetical protein
MTGRWLASSPSRIVDAAGVAGASFFVTKLGW